MLVSPHELAASTGPLIEISGKLSSRLAKVSPDAEASTGPLIEISGKQDMLPLSPGEVARHASTGPLIEISGKTALNPS